MKLYRLADDAATYKDQAGWWMVVTDDDEKELAGPFEYKETAEDWIKIDILRAALSEAAEVLRSGIAIAEREGSETNWDPFERRCRTVLHNALNALADGAK